MAYFNDLDRPDKLDAYFDEPEIEMFCMPDLEEMENLDDESHEDSPRPSRKNTKKSIRLKKKKRKRSSSVESDQDEDDVKAAPMSKTNKQINVGEEFQAVVPEDVSLDHADDEKDRDERLWETPENIDKEKLDRFVKESSRRYRVPIERALFILTKQKFNFKKAMDIIKTRDDLRDVWLDDEVNLFNNCYLHFGKNFKRICTAMPHRSITSIVQHYYDSKKRVNYKTFSDNKSNETCAEMIEEVFPYLDKAFDHMCENCGERCENMEEIKQSKSLLPRYECGACRSYYAIVDSPRPTSLRIVLNERLKGEFDVPDYLKVFMKEYDILSTEANGGTFRNRFMGEGQTLQDIVGMSYRAEGEPSPIKEEEEVRIPFKGGLFCWRPHVKKGEEILKEEFDDEPLDAPTSSTPDAPINTNLIPRIWNRRRTLCMEEIEVIAEDARRRKYDAVVAFSNANKKEVDGWRNEMNAMTLRMERMHRDIDLAPSYMKKDPPKQTTDWSESDIKKVQQLIRSHGPICSLIANVIGTKSDDQVEPIVLETSLLNLPNE